MLQFPIHRHQLGEYLNERGLTGTGVEVGSGFGAHARMILKTWQGQRLYLVDLWARQPDADYPDIGNQTFDFADWHQQCRLLAAEDKRVHLIQGQSHLSADKFSDASLDFVYIDANHAAVAVARDLEAWYPKVKPGGVFGGHDYMTKIDEGWYCQVPAAVDPFVAAHGLDLHISTAGCSSWWTTKPK
jgi:SAM-dependent methyltransferase